MATSTPLRAAAPRHAPRWMQYMALTKPRVVQLIVFCAVIGMLLAAPGVPEWRIALPATIGIWLVASAAAAFNCLVERQIDRKMARTAWRPTARGELTDIQALAFSLALGASGSLLLYVAVNPLTMWLTLATFVGYAIVYTVILKPLTPQNIVIGGAAGATPPLLGWVAVSGRLDAGAIVLFIIILIWTPPHFWALAIHRRADYARAGIPMLPVTHGVAFTAQRILAYTGLLVVVSLAPVAIGLAGALYGASALLLGARFTWFALRLRRDERCAMPTFRFSIVYLAALFAFLLIDHYVDAPLLQHAGVSLERVA